MIINYQDLQAQGTFKNTGTMQILATNQWTDFLADSQRGESNAHRHRHVIMGDGTNNAYNNQPAIGNNFGTGGIFTNESTIEGTGSYRSGTGASPTMA